MNEAEHVQFGHADNGLPWFLFAQERDQLCQQTVAGQPVQQVGFHCALDQRERLLAEMKAESLFEADRAKDPGGVIQKAHVVQYAQGLLFEVPATPVKIDELAEVARVQSNCHRVDSKITAIQVL